MFSLLGQGPFICCKATVVYINSSNLLFFPANAEVFYVGKRSGHVMRTLDGTTTPVSNTDSTPSLVGLKPTKLSSTEKIGETLHCLRPLLHCILCNWKKSFSSHQNMFKRSAMCQVISDSCLDLNSNPKKGWQNFINIECKWRSKKKNSYTKIYKKFFFCIWVGRSSVLFNYLS